MPLIIRKECRQLIGLGIGLEICTLYYPEVIAPNILSVLELVKQGCYEKFVCPCG